MAESLGRAVLELATDDGAFNAGVDRAEAGAEGLDRGLRRTSRSATTLGARLTALGGRLRSIGGRFQSIGRDMRTRITLPILGLGAAASALSSNFDASLSQIVGLVGLTAEEVDGMRDSVLALAGDTARAPKELAEALFFITSAGARGQIALDILEVSAQAAAAGLGETAVIADAVTSAINAYGEANLDASRATGILVSAVREGKASAESLAPVLGRLLPLASELGVSFDEVAAAIAAMSRLGLNAAEASTALRGILAQLLDPGVEARRVFEEFGLSVEQVQETLRNDGLLGTLTLLKTTFGDNREALAAVFPEIEGLTGVLNLVGENAEQTRQIFASLAEATGVDLARAFGVASEESSFKFQRSLAQMQVQLIRLGEAILPILVPALEKLTDIIVEAVDHFAALDPAMQETALIIVGAFAVGGPVLIALGAAAAAIAAIGVVPALVIAAIAGLATAWFAFGDDIKRVAGEIVAEIEAMVARWVAFGAEVAVIVEETFNAIKTFLVDRFLSIVDGVEEAINDVTGFFQGMWEDVVGNSFVPDMIDAIEEHFGRLGEAMVSPAAKATGDTINLFGEMERGGRGVLDRMAQDLKRGELSWRSFGETVAEVVNNILVRLIGAGLDAAVDALMPGSAVPAGAGGGTAGAGTISPQPVARAHGGRLGAMQPALVGERGIELFVPDVSGSVIPNDALRALGGGVVVNVTIDGRPATPDSVSDRQSGDGRREIEVLITDTVARDIGRNGPVSKAIAGTFGAQRRGIG